MTNETVRTASVDSTGRDDIAVDERDAMGAVVTINWTGLAARDLADEVVLVPSNSSVAERCASVLLLVEEPSWQILTACS